jgi:hypothetical protein
MSGKRLTQKRRPYRDYPLRPRSRMNGAVIFPASDTANMASLRAVSGYQTPSHHDVFFRSFLCEFASQLAPIPGSRTPSWVLPRSELLTRVVRALTARSSGLAIRAQRKGLGERPRTAWASAWLRRSPAIRYTGRLCRTDDDSGSVVVAVRVILTQGLEFVSVAASIASCLDLAMFSAFAGRPTCGHDAKKRNIPALHDGD